MPLRLTSLSIVLLFAPAVLAEDWPGFLGPRGTSVSSEKGIIAPWPEKGLRLVWHKPSGQGYAAPSLSQGKLYHFDRIAHKARLHCLDPRTGATQWTFTYPTQYRDAYNYNGGPRCCPVIDGDLIFLYGPEGMLHAVSTDGKLVWKVDTVKDFGVVPNFFGVGSTPIVSGDLLIAQVGGSPEGSNPRDFQALKGNGSGVVAFHKRTGKIAYQISDELASYSSPVLATIDGRPWCFVFARGGLLGFDPRTGKGLIEFPWRSDDLESVNASNPLVVGKQLFLSETYGPGAALLNVRLDRFEVVWSDAKDRRKAMQCHWMTPIHHDGYVYGSSGRHEANATLRCIEWATGKLRWSEPRLKRSSLLMVDGHFVCLSEDGVLRLLKVNPAKYEEISTLTPTVPATGQALLEYPCWAAPVLTNGLLYLRGEDRLVCLELIPQR